MFKLDIDAEVGVNVKGRLGPSPNGEPGKTFSFVLTMQRMTQGEINEVMKSGDTIESFIVGSASGWSGQRLVLNADNSPAEFSKEALRCLLTLPGMAVWCYQAYLRDVAIRE